MTKIFLSLFGLYLNFSHSFVIALHPAAAVDGVLMRPAYKKFISSFLATECTYATVRTAVVAIWQSII